MARSKINLTSGNYVSMVAGIFQKRRLVTSIAFKNTTRKMAVIGTKKERERRKTSIAYHIRRYNNLVSNPVFVEKLWAAFVQLTREKLDLQQELDKYKAIHGAVKVEYDDIHNLRAEVRRLREKYEPEKLVGEKPSMKDWHRDLRRSKSNGT